MRRLTRVLPFAVWSLIVSATTTRAESAVASRRRRRRADARHPHPLPRAPRPLRPGRPARRGDRAGTRAGRTRAGAAGGRAARRARRALHGARHQSAHARAGDGRYHRHGPARPRAGDRTDLAECTPPTWRQDVAVTLVVEETQACRDRLERVFGRLFVPSPDGDRHEILVCHGNVIRWLWCRALGVDPTAWLGLTIANCSLTVIQIRPDGSCKLFLFGDIGHLPPASADLPRREPAPLGRSLSPPPRSRLRAVASAGR